MQILSKFDQTHFYWNRVNHNIYSNLFKIMRDFLNLFRVIEKVYSGNLLRFYVCFIYRDLSNFNKDAVIKVAEMDNIK